MADSTPPKIDLDPKSVWSKAWPKIQSALLVFATAVMAALTGAVIGTGAASSVQETEVNVVSPVAPAATPSATVLPAPPTPTVVPAPTPTPAPPIVPRPGPKPAPKPKIAEQKIAGPTEPVPVGRLAKFTLPPTTSKSAGLWRVVARSTVVPDALVVESDGGLTAFVETAQPCVYDVSVAGLLEDGTVFHWATTLTVGESPRPPPVVVVPPGPGPVRPTPNDVVTSVTYVYDKEQGSIPSAVQLALDRINREKRVQATAYELGTRDGDDDIPAQYQVANATAEKEGCPLLVVQAGSTVLRIVKNPTTTEQVWEAAN